MNNAGHSRAIEHKTRDNELVIIEQLLSRDEMSALVGLLERRGIVATAVSPYSWIFPKAGRSVDAFAAQTALYRAAVASGLDATTGLSDSMTNGKPTYTLFTFSSSLEQPQFDAVVGGLISSANELLVRDGVNLPTNLPPHES